MPHQMAYCSVGETESSKVLSLAQGSCAYDPRWSCPLAPRDNTLKVAIRAGERVYDEH
jgi:hypothetical protein